MVCTAFPDLSVRAMTGRGTAFVTYKYEANAQFAKEAMMHQSLDHDEILNVRWAAEDPRSDGEECDEAERRQLAEKRISDRENERRELENDYADLKHDPSIDWEEYARAKRQRLALSEEEARRLDEENQRGWDAYYAEQKKAGAAAKPDAPSKSSLLNNEAMASLQKLRTKPATAPKPSSALGGLAAYASDSD